MATKRTYIGRPTKARLTPEVIAAWEACDYKALHAALNLHPWNHSPLPSEITALGVNQGDAPDYLGSHQRADWRRAQALQRVLLQAAGWPADAWRVYEENLQEAERWLDYCRRQLVHCDHQGTGSDLKSRRESVQAAKERVAYRKQLLAELDEKAET